MDLKSALANQSVSFGAWTIATGAPVTITSATSGLSLWYRRGVAGAKVAISPSNLATLETSHAEGGILVIEIGGAEHRLDLPDAAVAAGVLTVEWGGTATGITIDGGTANLIGQANTATDLMHWLGTAPLGLSSQRVQVDVQAIEGFTAAAVVLGWWLAEGLAPIADSGSTTTLVDATLTQADDYWNGSLLIFRTGTNVGRTAIVTDFDAGTDTLTFAPAVPDAVTTEGYVLVPGLGHADIAAISQDAVTKIQAGLSTYGGSDTAGTTEILTRIPDASPGAENGLPILDANGRVPVDVEAIDGSTLAAQVLAAKNYSYKDDAAVLVADGATDVVRGTAWLAAMATARTLTPGGNALSATNRAVVLIPPGRYDLVLGTTQTPAGGSPGDNHGLLLDTEFVDSIGLGDKPDDVVITSQIATASRGTVEQTANDVWMNGFTLDLNAATAGSLSTKNSAYFPASDLPLTQMQNCKTRLSGVGGYGMRVAITYSGTYENCIHIGGYGFGGIGIASGTFINCFHTEGDCGFGGDGVASGTFTNCRHIGNFGFGGDGVASGTFTNCNHFGVRGFAGASINPSTASGLFIDCLHVGVGGFGGFVGGTASGVFLNCTGGADSFEVGGSGLFIHCSRDGVLFDNATRNADVKLIKTEDADTAISARVDASQTGLDWADDGRLDLILDGRATPGAEMALTSGQVTAIVAAVEAEIADDATGEAIKQAIIDKLIENLPDLDDLSLAAIRNAILDRVLAGNHDTSGSLGKLVQEASTLDAAQVRTELAVELTRIDTNIGSRHASGAAVAKSPATLDWDGDVTNKPTIGTSTFDPSADKVTPTDASKSGYALSSAERSLVATAHLDLANGVETGVTPRQALQRMGAVLAGKISGAGTGTEVFLGLDGLTTRVTVTATSAGNRISVVYA